MKDLTTLVPKLKMSTKEVADLTGKRLADVNRDVVAMLKKLGKLGFDISGALVERDGRGYIKRIDLDKDLTFTLITGYDVGVRHKMVKRWSEMEEAVATTGSAAADRWYNAEEMAESFFDNVNSRKRIVTSAARDSLFNLRNTPQVAWTGKDQNMLEPSQFYVREDAYLMALAVMFGDITKFNTVWISNREYILRKLRVHTLGSIKGVHHVPHISQKDEIPLSEDEQWRRLIEED